VSHTIRELRVMCVIPIINNNNNNNNNNKTFLVHPMKLYRGRRGIEPLILNLSKRWR
jgi:hypothetical protein